MDNASGKPEDLAERVATDIPPKLQPAFTQVIKAGMKVMFSEQTHEVMLDELQQDGDFAERAGSAVADLMVFLYVKSNKGMPPEVIIPSAVYLLAKGADFISQVTQEEMSAEILSTAMDVMIRKLMARFGVDESKYIGALDSLGAGQKGAPVEAEEEA